MQIVDEAAEVFETSDFASEWNITPNGVETLTNLPDTFKLFAVLVAVAAGNDIAVVKGRFVFVGVNIDFYGSFFGDVGIVKSEEAHAQFFIEEVIDTVESTAGNFASELERVAVAENSKTFMDIDFEIGGNIDVAVGFTENDFIFAFGSFVGNDFKLCSGHFFKEI